MRIECEFSHITITTGVRHEPRHGSNPPHRPAGLAQGRDPTGLSDPAERGQLDRAGRLQLQAGHAVRASARTHPRRPAWTVAAQDCLRLAQRRPLRTRPRPAATHPGRQLQPSLQVPALAKAQETQTCGASLSSRDLLVLSRTRLAVSAPHRRVATLDSREELWPRQTQEHQPRPRNAVGAPLRNRSLGHFAKLRNLACTAELVDQLVRVHERQYRTLNPTRQ